MDNVNENSQFSLSGRLKALLNFPVSSNIDDEVKTIINHLKNESIEDTIVELDRLAEERKNDVLFYEKAQVIKSAILYINDMRVDNVKNDVFIDEYNSHFQKYNSEVEMSKQIGSEEWYRNELSRLLSAYDEAQEKFDEDQSDENYVNLLKSSLDYHETAQIYSFRYDSPIKIQKKLIENAKKELREYGYDYVDGELVKIDKSNEKVATNEDDEMLINLRKSIEEVIKAKEEKKIAEEKKQSDSEVEQVKNDSLAKNTSKALENVKYDLIDEKVSEEKFKDDLIYLMAFAEGFKNKDDKAYLEYMIEYHKAYAKFFEKFGKLDAPEIKLHQDRAKAYEERYNQQYGNKSKENDPIDELLNNINKKDNAKKDSEASKSKLSGDLVNKSKNTMKIITFAKSLRDLSASKEERKKFFTEIHGLWHKAIDNKEKNLELYYETLLKYYTVCSNYVLKYDSDNKKLFNDIMNYHNYCSDKLSKLRSEKNKPDALDNVNDSSKKDDSNDFDKLEADFEKQKQEKLEKALSYKDTDYKKFLELKLDTLKFMLDFYENNKSDDNEIENIKFNISEVKKKLANYGKDNKPSTKTKSVEKIDLKSEIKKIPSSKEKRSEFFEDVNGILASVRHYRNVNSMLYYESLVAYYNTCYEYVKANDPENTRLIEYIMDCYDKYTKKLEDIDIEKERIAQEEQLRRTEVKASIVNKIKGIIGVKSKKKKKVSSTEAKKRRLDASKKMISKSQKTSGKVSNKKTGQKKIANKKLVNVPTDEHNKAVENVKKVAKKINRPVGELNELLDAMSPEGKKNKRR